MNETEAVERALEHGSVILITNLRGVFMDATSRFIHLVGDPEPSVRIVALNTIARMANHGN
jgi:hypothetical protein